MIPTLIVFEQSPDGGQGQARDMRVRWALEEVDQVYNLRLVSFTEMKEPAYRALQPFGQIPVYQHGDLTLFESGSIVFHIAEPHPVLLPREPNARARAITWMFAALNTLEPPIVEIEMSCFFDRGKAWYEERLNRLQQTARVRLAELNARLGSAEWLDGAFSAGDLLMVMVLRRLDGAGLVEEFPGLQAYVARGEARPAFKRAYEAQRVLYSTEGN